MCFLYFCVFFPMLDCQNWLLVETPGHQKLILSSAIISHEPILVGWNVKINLFETQCPTDATKGLGWEASQQWTGPDLMTLDIPWSTADLHSWPSDTPAPQLPPHSHPPRGFEQCLAGRNPLQCPPGHGEFDPDELAKTWGCMLHTRMRFTSIYIDLHKDAESRATISQHTRTHTYIFI